MCKKVFVKVVKAVDDYLREHSQEETLLLWTISVVADSAARQAGRKSDVYESLFDYNAVLPPGTRCAWIKSFYRVLNPYYKGIRTAAEEKPPMPGFFDAAVDMGPARNAEIYNMGEQE